MLRRVLSEVLHTKRALLRGINANFTAKSQCLAQGAKEDAAFCSTICYADVHKAVSNNTLIIDVRTKQEVADTGLIPGSINIPQSCLREKLELPKGDFKEEFLHAKPKKRDLIVLTGRANCPNTNAAMTLTNLGYTRVADFVGGYDEWERQIAAGGACKTASKAGECGDSKTAPSSCGGGNDTCGTKTTEASNDNCDQC